MGLLYFLYFRCFNRKETNNLNAVFVILLIYVPKFLNHILEAVFLLSCLRRSLQRSLNTWGYPGALGHPVMQWVGGSDDL